MPLSRIPADNKHFMYRNRYSLSIIYVNFMPSSSPALIAMKFLNKGQTVTCSMRTAFMMISFTLSSDGLCIKCLNMRQAKSQCKPWKEVSENYFRNTDLKEHRVSGITFATLLLPTDNFLPHQKASQASSASESQQLQALVRTLQLL